MKNITSKIFIFTIFLSILISSCSSTPPITEQQTINEYKRGLREDCYFNPISIMDNQPIFLSQETCNSNIEKSMNEDFYHRTEFKIDTLSDAYYAGLIDDCLYNPIGADNNLFIFRQGEYCKKWISTMKNLGIYEKNITSNGDTIKIPDFLMTPIAPEVPHESRG